MSSPVILIAIMLLFSSSFAKGINKESTATEAQLNDKKSQKLIEQFLTDSSQKKNFKEKNILLSELQKKVSQRVDELVPAQDEKSSNNKDKAASNLSTDEVVSLNVLLSMIDLKSEKSCDADMARIKNAEPPFVDEKTGQKDYTTGTSARLALKILSAVCNKK